MKRIEAIIPNEKISAVNEAFKKAGIGGCTILEAKGRGRGEKPMVESGRGTGRFVSEFSVRANVITVVPDSQVENVVNAILDSVSTGSAGDGKIFISPVLDTIDVGTKQRGDEAVI
ncbi:MAG TPA: P-II family nitrogen regulator [Nitrososphaeraceae archaeon]|jgi:nitrogen regulatory protein P-II 1|nr:P-II family nitrogen regulator [Nitrososphaeraceae archaeon]